MPVVYREKLISGYIKTEDKAIEYSKKVAKKLSWFRQNKNTERGN